jgi:hypothetical protein
MKRLLLAAAIAIPLSASAQQDKAVMASDHTVSSATATVTGDRSVKTEIDGVMSSLSKLVQEGDALVAHLKQAVGTKTQDTQKAVDNAAQVLSSIADRASPDSDLRKILLDARNAALTHRKVVADMPSGMISEEGRTRALAAWDDVLKTADRATAGMADIHDQFLVVLRELRMRQTEVSELLLAEQYQAALDSVVKWVADLQITVKQLHGVLINNPTS